MKGNKSQTSLKIFKPKKVSNHNMYISCGNQFSLSLAEKIDIKIQSELGVQAFDSQDPLDQTFSAAKVEGDILLPSV